MTCKTCKGRQVTAEGDLCGECTEPLGTWQPIETAPFGSSDKPETYFIGARRNGLRISVATCYRNKYGAYEWWGGGMTPTHWMPFPSIGILGC